MDQIYLLQIFRANGEIDKECCTGLEDVGEALLMWKDGSSQIVKYEIELVPVHKWQNYAVTG